jgi:hypothetical protein
MVRDSDERATYRAVRESRDINALFAGKSCYHTSGKLQEISLAPRGPTVPRVTISAASARPQDLRVIEGG